MRWAAIFVLSGCSSILGIDDFKLGDAGGGEMADASGYCLGPAGFQVCLQTKPTNDQSINQTLSFDTLGGGGNLCAATQPASWKAQSQPDACFIIAANVTITAPVQARGARPLVIFAADTITIKNQLDVASHNISPSQIQGPAAMSPPCGTATAPAQGGATGGGGGGSFMTKGGDGGASSSSLAGGIAAQAVTSAPTLLRGGCPGTAGAATSFGVMGGEGGFGGGAVYLVAGTRIVIEGSINASGAAGGGGAPAAGGGGGGSGGMILLHAPAIGGNGGVVIANGGAGGGGGGGGLNGNLGSEPTPMNPTAPAPGGPGGQAAGAGGPGFAGSSLARPGSPGQAGASAAGGGGGGGASGYIRANIALSSITSSPDVSIVAP